MKWPRDRTIATVAGLCLAVTGAGITAMRGERASAADPPIACEGLPFDKSFTEKLTRPPVKDMRGGGSVTLTALGGQHRFQSGLATATRTLGYWAEPGQAPADLYGGPTIVARQDRPIQVTNSNLVLQHPLGRYIDPTIPGSAKHEYGPYGVIHLHGAAQLASADGEPTDRVALGRTKTYTYTNAQEAAGLWYHDHYLGNTRLSVRAGLAGQYWLRDQNDTGEDGNRLGLPAGGADLDYEWPLTIQDQSFARDGSLCPQRSAAGVPPHTFENETYGDTPVVNGVAYPRMDVKQGTYRFHVLNASNARFYRIKLTSSSTRTPTVLQVGSDGGLLNRPVDVTAKELILSPGARVDLVVDFRGLEETDEVTMANSLTPDDAANAYFHAGTEPSIPTVMKFKVTNEAGSTALPALGSDLRPENGITPLAPDATRYLNLTSGPHGYQIDQQAYVDPTSCAPSDKACRWVVNMTRAIRPDRADDRKVEEWVIRNYTGIAHPIHLHATQFQIKGMAGIGSPPDQPKPPTETADPLPAGGVLPPDESGRGWNDTITVLPNFQVHIIVPFAGTNAGIDAPFSGGAGGTSLLMGDYVFHCHILEHEDMDMMQPLSLR